jgi:S1-C subfamily serine protease
MRDRGQLSQFHEVSEDRKTWVKATELDELFGRGNDVRLEHAGPANSGSTSAAVAEWFYQDATGTQGPTTANHITSLIQGGQLSADGLVWKDGMPNWVKLGDVPSFAASVSNQLGISTGQPPLHDLRNTTAGKNPSSRSTGRFALIGATALLVIVSLGGVSFLVVERYLFKSSPTTKTNAAAHAFVESHTSREMSQATGLVVSGAVITDLRTGDLIESPGNRGTCFAVNSRGHLLTNRHVVEDHVKLTRADAKLKEIETTKSWRVKPKLWVYIAAQRYEAVVLYKSEKYDLAVMKIERAGPYYKLSDSPNIVQGTQIYAVGFPAASSQPLSIDGAIEASRKKLSEKAETVLSESDFRYTIADGIISLVRDEAGVEYVQHGAQISGGNSGGPLIYADGTVLGINTLVTFDTSKPGVGVKYYAQSITQAVSELSHQVPEMLAQ